MPYAALIPAAGALLGALFGNNKPAVYTPRIDPRALDALTGLNLEGVDIPGAEALWQNIGKAYSALKPQQMAMTSNAARSIEAGATRDRMALAGSLGSGVGSASIARAGQIAGANTAQAAEEIAGQIAGQTTGLAGQATQFDVNKALQEIQKIIAMNTSQNQNLMARVNQANLSEQAKMQASLGNAQYGTDPLATGLKGLGVGLDSLTGNDPMSQLLKMFQGGGGGASATGNEDLLSLLAALGISQPPGDIN